MPKYTVYEVEFGGDVDGTGSERWRGAMLGQFKTEAEADAFIELQNCYCELDVE